MLNLHTLLDLALVSMLIYNVYRYEHMRSTINKNFEDLLGFLKAHFPHKSAPQAPSPMPSGPTASTPPAPSTTEAPKS